MIKKILVANRGEIACRIFKTAKKMGIRTVAVYSKADVNALHVKMADEAIFIGEPPAAQSYLDIDKIIEACKKTGADAVHPGYGFLSENAIFATKLAENNINFIAPPIEAIRLMGDKITSKNIAIKAGVNVVPGYNGDITDIKHAIKIAKDIRYPIMLKASAGGGGKGMRIANNEEELQEVYPLTKAEAKASFGDDRVFIEKYIVKPRHIEIQVLGDKNGNLVHLFERECSIQRRHQKVIEEAPSPFLDEFTRQEMAKQALSLAKNVGYYSAGTVEFIVDQEKKFYFLEMNTRLQVEHPITEMITGIDLVEQMIRVANGESLKFTQENLHIQGWAIESRIYAENPYVGFMPSVGRIREYAPPMLNKPTPSQNLRNDTGIESGSEISIYYDPMISKLVVSGVNRDEAIEMMRVALDHYNVDGIQHNIPFLSSIFKNQEFINGNLHTGFIEQHYPNGFQGDILTNKDLQNFAAITLYVHTKLLKRNYFDFSNLNQYLTTLYNIPWVIDFKGNEQDGHRRFFATSSHETPSLSQIVVTDESKEDVRLLKVMTSWQYGRVKIDDTYFAIQFEYNEEGYIFKWRGSEIHAVVRTPYEAEIFDMLPVKEYKNNEYTICCPTPGIVKQIFVSKDDIVMINTPLLTVEAMKMENIIRANRSGKIENIHVQIGDNIAADSLLIELKHDM
jgi:propionyl-CoA carboxylase alpha chain